MRELGIAAQLVEEDRGRLSSASEDEKSFSEWCLTFKIFTETGSLPAQFIHSKKLACYLQ